MQKLIENAIRGSLPPRQAEFAILAYRKSVADETFPEIRGIHQLAAEQQYSRGTIFILQNKGVLTKADQHKVIRFDESVINLVKSVEAEPESGGHVLILNDSLPNESERKRRGSGKEEILRIIKREKVHNEIIVAAELINRMVEETGMKRTSVYNALDALAADGEFVKTKRPEGDGFILTFSGRADEAKSHAREKKGKTASEIIADVESEIAALNEKRASLLSELNSIDADIESRHERIAWLKSYI